MAFQENCNLKPIIGLNPELFGYISNGGGNKGLVFTNPSFSFHFCDEKGNDVDYAIDKYIFLSENQHYFTTKIPYGEGEIIVVKSDGQLMERGRSHSKNVYVLNYRTIGKYGLAICFNKELERDYSSSVDRFFHPIDFLSKLQSPIIVNFLKKEVYENKYYLLSAMNLHFIVDVRNNNLKDYNDFVYYMLDSDGNIVKTWDKNDTIRCIWQRRNGSITIFSSRDYNGQFFGASDGDSSNNNSFSELVLTEVNENYTNLTFEDYKTECEDYYEKKKAQNQRLPFDNEDAYECDAEKPVITVEGFVKWRENKGIVRNSFIMENDNLESLTYINKNVFYGWNYYEMNSHFQGLFCDSNYFVVMNKCGFSSFDKNRLLSTNNLCDYVEIDKFNLDDRNFEPATIYNKYGNGIVGLQFIKKYIGYFPKYDEDFVDPTEEIGNYKIFDLFGHCIGELRDGVLYTPFNEIGFAKYKGVVREDFSIVIPPIFNEILPMNRFVQKTETGSELVQLYIASQVVGNGGHVLQGIFNQEKEIVPLGDNVIKKVSGEYALVKDVNSTYFKLYGNNGRILSEKVKDVEIFHVYNVDDIKNRYVEPMLSYSKVIFSNGFNIFVNTDCIVDELIQDMTPVLYNSNDVFYKASMLKGESKLISVKNGIVLSDFHGKLIKEIDNAFLYIDHYDDCGYRSYIAQVVKSGDEFTSDEINLLNRDNIRDWKLYCKAEEALLVNLNGFYHIIRDYRNDVVPEDFSEDDAWLFSLGDRSIPLNSSTIVPGVRFVDRTDALKSILNVELQDGSTGFYEIGKGWLVEPEETKALYMYNQYIIYNNNIIKRNGDLTFFSSVLEFICGEEQISAYYVESDNNYIIIDSDGCLYSELHQLEDGTLVSNHLEEYCETQLVLNLKERKVIKRNNPNYKPRHSSLLGTHEGNEWAYNEHDDWTDEDSWDAMTDGQYGEYPGSGWDLDKFGY